MRFGVALGCGRIAQAASWREKVNAWKSNYNRHANLVAGEPEPCPICDACEAPTFCYPKYGAVCPELQCQGTTHVSRTRRTLHACFSLHLWQSVVEHWRNTTTSVLPHCAGVKKVPLTSLIHCAAGPVGTLTCGSRVRRTQLTGCVLTAIHHPTRTQRRFRRAFQAAKATR